MDLVEHGFEEPIEHWYYSYKFNAILKALDLKNSHSGRLIDVGAGSALFSREIACMFPELSVTAIDINYSDSDLLTSTTHFKLVRDIKGVTGEIYLMNDVLEHIYDDNTFLKSIVESAPLGALFIFTVPTLMSLWSGHDVYLKHFRRYTKSQFLNLTKSSGLTVSYSSYLFGTLYPVAFLVRKLGSKKSKSQLKKHSKITNIFIKRFLYIDQKICHRLPFGISLICVAKKQ